ncbi:short-chain dehydrogenase [Chitinispirillum alkaliphilum]|nr:short-chain dehydrogenase [Chitinispirillum alkaliphilum]
MIRFQTNTFPEFSPCTKKNSPDVISGIFIAVYSLVETFSTVEGLMKIKGSVVIVTGASSGIGAATATLFRKRGAKVVLAARNSLAIKDLQSQFGSKDSIAVTCDITDSSDVKLLAGMAIHRFGKIDLLINNAGQGLCSNILELQPQHLKSILDTNTIGPLLCIQTVAPFMIKNGGGVIMNVSTMATSLSTPGSGGYRASKLALEALTESARLELKKDNIRLITVYPGLTKTNFFKNALRSHTDIKQQTGTFTPRGRSPEYVAAQILRGAQKEPHDVYMGVKSRVLGRLSLNFPNLAQWMQQKRT